MKRMGSHKRPFYRIVAADTRYQRDGRFLEIIGYYDPMVKPYKLEIDREKVNTWLQNGAQMSETVESLLRKEGIVQEFNLGKVNARKKTEEVPSPSGEGV
jgi:small subunit ribosomal protein S16